MMLSLIMPVYNEGRTLQAVLERLGDVDMPIPWELIIVDDGSHDGAVDDVDRSWVPSAERVLVAKSRQNRGKGSAIRKGFSLASGEILGVQDADLEYDPRQIPEMIAPILEGKAEVVFGTRQFGSNASYSFWYFVGNRLMSVTASAIFNRYITDAYTCYKFMTARRYEQLTLTANGFDIEAELTGGLLRSGAQIYEVPITYTARSREEGKKISARDGLFGISRLLRVRLLGTRARSVQG